MNAPQPFAEASLAGVLVHVEERLRAADSLAALRFSIANGTHALLPYRQAFVWSLDGARVRLQTVSGLATPVADAPFSQWLDRLGASLAARDALDGDYVGAQDVPAAVAADWAEWLPEWL
ncbi:MAG TPA: hypothetical protein PKC20_12460, partial [Burkholderiaceae bacterium]|nr:hypothetical protein [Burkholderiaceae bacterium]